MIFLFHKNKRLILEMNKLIEAILKKKQSVWMDRKSSPPLSSNNFAAFIIKVQSLMLLSWSLFLNEEILCEREKNYRDKFSINRYFNRLTLAWCVKMPAYFAIDTYISWFIFSLLCRTNCMNDKILVNKHFECSSI